MGRRSRVAFVVVGLAASGVVGHELGVRSARQPGPAADTKAANAKAACRAFAILQEGREIPEENKQASAPGAGGMGGMY